MGIRRGVFYVVRIMSHTLGTFVVAPGGLGYVQDMPAGYPDGNPVLTKDVALARRFQRMLDADRWWAARPGLHRYAVSVDTIQERPSASAIRVAGRSSDPGPVTWVPFGSGAQTR